MKNRTFALFLAATSISLASESIVVFQDDFSTDTLSADYDTHGVNYNQTPETVTIQRGYNNGGNYLEISEPFALDTGSATELTVAFDYAFGSGMYGSGFKVEYNDNTGTGWQVIDTINYTGTNANNNGEAANPYTVTITEGAAYNFTDGARIRLKATDVNGGDGYNFDNLTVSVDSVAEPSKGTVIMISSLGGWFVLMFGFIFWREIRQAEQSHGTSASQNKFETQR